MCTLTFQTFVQIVTLYSSTLNFVTKVIALVDIWEVVFTDHRGLGLCMYSSVKMSVKVFKSKL